MNFNSILVIDDSKYDRFIASEFLESYATVNEIICVDSAQAGLDYIKSIEEILERLPEIILLDIRMPKMDGFDFLNGFATFSSEVKQKCKVFMLSSSVDPYDISRAEKSIYVFDFIEKPLSEEKILKLESFFEEV